MTYQSGFDVEINRACIMTAKDHRQRWVYSDRGIVRITTDPIPYRDAVSVRWLPIHQTVVFNWRYRVLAHPACEVMQ
jgi:hypothetical protein